MTPIKKIDIHAHVLGFPEFHPGNAVGHPVTADELIEIYDRLNIEKGMVLPLASPEASPVPFSNESCAAAAARYPSRLGWFCSVDPRCWPTPDYNFTPLLENYRSLGAKAIGEMVAKIEFDDPRMDNLLAHCAACKMPVLIHIASNSGDRYGVIDEVGLPRLERMLKKHPDLIVIGHSQPFWAEISADVTDTSRGVYANVPVTEGRLYELMRTYSNLCCDLSAGSGLNALRRDKENAIRFLNEFSDRIMFGTDTWGIASKNGALLDEFLTDLRESGRLSDEKYRNIVRENAIRILRLAI